jgi:hypothetical protein
MSSIHIKVRWAALAGALAALLTALGPTVGVHYGATWASVLTAICAALAGYSAPSVPDNQDPEAVSA